MTRNSSFKLIDVMSDVFGSFTSLGDDLMMDITPKAIRDIEKEKVFTTSTFGGGIFVHVKNGRVIKTDPLTVPEDVHQYRIECIQWQWEITPYTINQAILLWKC